MTSRDPDGSIMTADQATRLLDRCTEIMRDESASPALRQLAADVGKFLAQALGKELKR